jgi:hypothetical protein
MVGQMEKLETLKRRDVASVAKLETARQALALASEIPDIAKLIDNAEAVRAVAKALHISVSGINAWTRFVVDAERKAWARIEAMRAAGELAKQGHHKGKNADLAFLTDLIDHRAHERAAEWSALAKLNEDQLDAIERDANEEDRIVTRLELLKLSKAGERPEVVERETRSTTEFELLRKGAAHRFGRGLCGRKHPDRRRRQDQPGGARFVDLGVGLGRRRASPQRSGR